MPGCDAKLRMVISARLNDKPHHVKKGKGQGEYQCSRSCPRWGALKICSHVIVTADANNELTSFLEWHN